MDEPYLTAKEVAAHYGVKVQTIWKWIKQGKIPAYKLGSRIYRFKRSELPILTK